MSDYIKREDAIKAMARGLGIPYTDFIDVAERCIDDIPPADVVEVVRCKDCKWWKPFNDKMGDCGYEMRHKDFYCERGERADT